MSSLAFGGDVSYYGSSYATPTKKATSTDVSKTSTPSTCSSHESIGSAKSITSTSNFVDKKLNYVNKKYILGEYDKAQERLNDEDYICLDIPKEYAWECFNILLESFESSGGRCADRTAVRVQLLNGSIIITEFPSVLHEIVIGLIEESCVVFKIHAGIGDRIACIRSSRVNYVEGQSRLEADSAWYNKRAPKIQDENGIAKPNAVLEVGYSEAWRSLHDAACVYLTSINSPVRMVIVIKLFKPSGREIADANHNAYPQIGSQHGTRNELRIHRMACLIYERAIGETPDRVNTVALGNEHACCTPRRVISFGSKDIARSNVSSIRTITGFQGNVEYLQYNNDAYPNPENQAAATVTIPANYWMEGDPNPIANIVDWTIPLDYIRRELIENEGAV